MKVITSLQNPFVKHLVQLQEKSKLRKQTGTFIIEGKREIELAVRGNYQIDSILYCSDFITNDEINELLLNNNNTETTQISKEVYQKLAYRDTTEGVIAVTKSKNIELDELILPENPLIVVLESLEKPGNIGAVLRTCDAARVDAVLIANPKTDLYNPNIVRASVGCLFTNQISLSSSEAIIKFLEEKNINIYSAVLQSSSFYHKEYFTQGTAIALGTEATGLSAVWRNKSKKNIIIPMLGAIDSMNVSVAAAILIFEAKRQRNFH